MRSDVSNSQNGMTVAEAALIVHQFEEGALDPDLPGTMELVDEARRVGVAASLWGAEDGRPHTARRRRLLMACCAIATITCVGLTLVFATSS